MKLFRSLSKTLRKAINGKTECKVFPCPNVSRKPQCRHNITVAAIVKDEAKYLCEWLSFHLAVGVDHFAIYDNGSTDNAPEVLEPFIVAGHVTVIPWPHFVVGYHTQALAYAHALALFGQDSRWMAFIDVDEFLFSPEKLTLPEVMRDYDDLPAINVFRHFFGTSGHRTPPWGSVIDNFNIRHEPPTEPVELRGFQVPKTIAQPRFATGTIGAHRLLLPEEGLWGYDEMRRPVRRSSPAAFTAKRLCVNHYYTKDEETFLKRTMRKFSAANLPVPPGEYDAAYAKLSQAGVRDIRIQAWSGLTRERMAQFAGRRARLTLVGT